MDGNFPLGNPITLTYTVKVAGVPTHAIGGVTISAELHGTKTSPTPVAMTEGAAGIYTYTFEPGVDGVYDITAISLNPDTSANLQIYVEPHGAG